MPHQCTNCDRTFADGSKEMLSGCPECGGSKFQFRPGGFDDGPADGSGSDGAARGDPVDESSPEPAEGPGDAMTRTVGNAAATVRDLVSGSASPDATQAKPPAERDAAQDGRSGAQSAPSGSASAAADSTAGSSTSAATDSGDDDIIVAESEPLDTDEDAAQSDARSQLVEPDEMPDAGGFDPADSADWDGESGSDAPIEERQTTPVDREPVDGTDADRADGVAASDVSGVDSEEPGVNDDDEPDVDRTVADEPDSERADRPDLAELREELNDQFESIRVVEPGQYELNLMELYDREEYIIALQEDGRYSIQVPETWRQADA